MDISVILPIYNVESYLLECLESLANQTIDKATYEVLCIDDGSIDNSAEIARNFCEEHSNFKYYYKKNGGLSDARNYGIKISKANYVCFVDSDDKIANNYLEVLYNLCVNNECDIANCKYYDYYGEEIKTKNDFEDNIIVLDYKQALDLILVDDEYGNYAWNKMYARHLFLDVEYPLGKYFEDLYTTYKVFLSSKKIAFSNKKLYFYRKRQGSIVSTLTESKVMDFANGLKQRYNELVKIGVSNLDYNYFKFSIYIVVQSLKIMNTKMVKNKFKNELQFIKENRRLAKMIDKKNRIMCYLILMSPKALKFLVCKR